MKNKKKTLPKNIDQLIQENNMEELKKVYEVCEIDAIGGMYYRMSAIRHPDASEELIRWLVANGANLEDTESYHCGATVLNERAGFSDNHIDVLLELGADIHTRNNDGNTPLHTAAGNCCPDNVKILLEYDAEPNAVNNDKRTPLEHALFMAPNTKVVRLVEITKLLLPKTPQITQDMKDAITRIGEEFEFYRRDSIKEGCEDEAKLKKWFEEDEAALNELYKIYAVPSVKKRVVHDGVSQITVTGTTWGEQFDELWDFLVPSRGSAITVQGEVIRIAGAIDDEISRNGGCNWSATHKKNLDAYLRYLKSGNPLTKDEIEKVSLLVPEIRKSGLAKTDELDFLCELAVKWVVLNPVPMKIEKKPTTKKKKTLPKNIDQLIQDNNLEELKKVYETCEIDATGSVYRRSALRHFDASDELIRWMVANGADLEAKDNYGLTVLNDCASNPNGKIAIFLELGADIQTVDNNGDTPLHRAAGRNIPKFIKQLLDYGADPNALNNNKQTPLECALFSAEGIDIVDLLEVSKLLMQENTRITQEMKNEISRIGNQFEFYRENYIPEEAQKTETALNKLYEIYGVPPAEKRITHDNVSPITVSRTTWQKQFDELWSSLVPASGSAQTVQGEVIRIAGKIGDEIERNGGGNWNTTHKEMLDTFFKYLKSGKTLPNEEIGRASLLIQKIRKYGYAETAELDFLCELAVKWVLLNPMPIKINAETIK